MYKNKQLILRCKILVPLRNKPISKNYSKKYLTWVFKNPYFLPQNYNLHFEFYKTTIMKKTIITTSILALITSLIHAGEIENSRYYGSTRDG